jgi:hypothetical protein
MNAYIFDIYIMHSIMLEHKDEEGTFTTYHDLLEIVFGYFVILIYRNGIIDIGGKRMPVNVGKHF